MLLPTVFLLVVFSVLAEAKKHHKHPKIHHGTSILDLFEYDDGNGHFKMLQDDLGNEPPESTSQIANLFQNNIINLLETNSGHSMATIAKYRDPENLELLSCHLPGTNMNFAVFKQRISYLHHYFKEVRFVSNSFSPPSGDDTSFKIILNAVSQDNKNIELVWEGEARFNHTENHYLYTKLSMVSDCSQIPEEFPTSPSEPLDDFIGRVKNELLTELFKDGQKVRQKAGFQAFVDAFVIHDARVVFCERPEHGVQNRDSLSDYFWQRYSQIGAYSDHDFKVEKVNDEQTDLMFSVKVNDQTIDTYRFRIRAQQEVKEGWPHWWIEFVQVMCPQILNQASNPEALQNAFVGQVCNSLPGLVNNGPSYETRIAFMSHMMTRADAGFWALICDKGNFEMNYTDLDAYMEELATGYKNAELSASTIDDSSNLQFTCNLQLTREDTGVTVKKHFRLRAFYETDQWLVKEVRISCDE